MNIDHISEYKRILTDSGLEPPEASIYLAALQIGGGTIMEISKAGKLERTGIYYYLKKLIDQNLLKVTRRGKRTIYLPADPDTLKSILQRKQTALNSILPDLNSHFSIQTGKSIVTTYQGHQEIIELHERLYDIAKLSTPEDRCYILGHSFEAVEALPEFYPQYFMKRAKLRIETRAVLPQSERPPKKLITSDPKLIAQYTLHLTERRYLRSKYAYPGTTIILKNYVAAIDFKTFFGTLTESQNLAQTWRTFFEFIWDHLPKR